MLLANDTLKETVYSVKTLSPTVTSSGSTTVHHSFFGSYCTLGKAYTDLLSGLSLVRENLRCLRFPTCADHMRQSVFGAYVYLHRLVGSIIVIGIYSCTEHVERSGPPPTANCDTIAFLCRQLANQRLYRLSAGKNKGQKGLHRRCLLGNTLSQALNLNKPLETFSKPLSTVIARMVAGKVNFYILLGSRHKQDGVYVLSSWIALLVNQIVHYLRICYMIGSRIRAEACDFKESFFHVSWLAATLFLISPSDGVRIFPITF